VGHPPNTLFVTKGENVALSEYVGIFRQSMYIRGNGFSGFGKEGGEGAGIAKGMPKRETDRQKEAKVVLIPAIQAHANMHAHT
jgi:hypothetical protein